MIMRVLEITYRLDGQHRGYQYVGSTAGFNDDTLKAVWRTAMPRGQGWGSPVYQGAHALKSFSLPDGRFALSETRVTDQQDENGRTGIRYARIEIMQPSEYGELLSNRLNQFPEWVQNEVHRDMGLFGRRRIPSVSANEQVVLSRSYNADDWILVEAFVLSAAVKEYHRRWRGSHFVAFTTLALDWRGESPLVVVPTDRSAGVKTVSI